MLLIVVVSVPLPGLGGSSEEIESDIDSLWLTDIGQRVCSRSKDRAPVKYVVDRERVWVWREEVKRMKRGGRGLLI